MCPSLTNEHALDYASTSLAGFALPLINLETILKVPAAVDPINAGTIAADALLQDFPDGTVKFFSLNSG